MMILSSPKPWFEARVIDPDGRNVGLSIEVEHDPSVPAQGTGQIWTYIGGTGSASGSTIRYTIDSGKLQDGWTIRWRARGLTSSSTGAWSVWQTAKLDVSKPAVSLLASGPGTAISGTMILSSPRPWFEAKVTDPDGRNVGLSIEVEHDPSVPAQGTGQIWAYTGGAGDPNGSTVRFTASYGVLKDGWLIRWRARGITPTESSQTLYGPWSGWQTAKLDISKPAVSDLAAGPGASGDGQSMLSSLTPWFEARVIDPDGRNVGMSVEVEHDPSAAGQGNGRIWSFTGGSADPSGSYVSYNMPSGRLKDGWLIRWRVRGITPTETSDTLYGPWSGWQAARVDISKPAASNLASGPGTTVSGLTVLSTLTPWLEAKISDPDGRNVGMSVEIEHDPSVPSQGSGKIWSSTGGAGNANGSVVSFTVSSGVLKDGWLIRWRARGITPTESSQTLYGPWSGWQTARLDITKPAVSALSATPGVSGTTLSTLTSLTPSFGATVSDAAGRNVGLSVEVEHDPSVLSQGSGRIWSYTGGAGNPSGSAIGFTIDSGKLQDGWLIRWRARGITPTESSQTLYGPWSGWQTARLDITKPAVSALSATPGVSGTTLSTLTSLTPSFGATVSDAAGRNVGLSVEVEHDPSVLSQGSGRIWSYTGGAGNPSGSAIGFTIDSGKLRDGWLIRWRARGITPTESSQTLYGPWSVWQTARIQVNNPAGSGLGAVPATQGTGLWTFSSLTPWLYSKITSPNGAAAYLGAEVEHDPSTPDQGAGLIWSGQGTTAYASGSNVWVQVPSGKLTDGWRIRWRVRGVPTSGMAGAWSDWQSAVVALTQPSVAGAGMTPGTSGAAGWTISSLTPWVFGKVTSSEGRASYLGVEIEHDPSASAQGTGLIWAGQSTTSYASDANAWLQVPSGKLTDGWQIRWRSRGVTTTGVKGPWSDWQAARVNLNVPSVEGLGMAPARRGTASWSATTLTPSLYAKVTDPDNRASQLAVEIEHDPAVPEQGTGQIYAGKSTTSYPSGSNAWMAVPTGKLQDGWLFRWRVRAVTTTGVNGPWSGWQSGVVTALPFISFAPEHNSQAGSLEPTLSAHAQSANENPVTYWFQLCAGTPSNWTWCESTPTWEKSGTWSLSNSSVSGAHKLAWGQTYWWQAKATSGTMTVTSSWRAFTPTPEQGTINSSLGEGTNGRAFNHSSGNFTHTETDVAVAVTGPPLSVMRTYNSLDPRTGEAFGAGWSTRWDMRIEPEPQTSTLLVTYPGGEQLRFAAKGDGTYASPSGTYATLASLPEGGWRLMDKSATSYWFDASGRLTKVADHRNRTQELIYGADGKLAKATGTGGRSLTFTWTGDHVTGVSTDPVNGAPLTWTYTYDGDKLVKVCPPNTGTACSVYSYGDASRYRSAVLDSGPEGYWRLNETATATGTKIVNSSPVLGSEEAKLTGTTADATSVPGALTGSPDTALRFKSTAGSTYVALPQATISGQGGHLAVEAWFRTTGSGTIIGYQNSAANTPTAFTPGLYIGTDGKLRGQFYTGTPAPITSSGPVNDGNWHHVVLSGAHDSQTLYLDGQAVGTLAGKITHVGQWETRIGAGFGSSAWPATTSSTAAFPFAGDIDEVAVYGKPLGAQVVRTHYAARQPQPQLTKAVAPSGRTEAENVYAADGGRLTQHTDVNGGAWKLSAPVHAKETTVYTSATTTVTDPHGGTLTYVDDVSRGGRQVSMADQLGQTSRYTYDVGGYPAKIFDPNGNVTEVAFNARGNLVSKKTCRTADNCSSEYFNHYLNIDNPFDPRNDLRTGHRDARSASATDETYMTSWSYNAFGEETKHTTPPTSDFPQGRSTAKVYTDGSEPAVGGGLTPAGLVKSSKDFKGNETTYAYTAAGDLATETSPTGLVRKYEHDALGRLVTQTEISEAFPDGVKTTITYDGLGKVTSRTGTGVKNDVTGVTHTSQWTGTYDADGLPLTESVADLTGGDATRTTTYTYDDYGRVETITGPEGGVQRFGYDHKGQKTGFTDERGTTYHYGYTARGEPATTTLKGWTGSPVNPQPAADVVMSSMAYDPAGRLASQTDAMGRTTAYTYFTDNLPAEKIAKGARLNGSTTPRDVVLESRLYDAAGNPTRQITGNGTLRVDATYDAARRLVTQTVDPGTLNRVTTAAYDANDNMVKVSQSVGGTGRTEITEYAYDAADKPIRQTVRNDGQDLVTTFTMDDRGLVTEVTDPRGNASGADPAAFTTSVTYDAAGLPTRIQLPPVTVERAGAPTSTLRPTTKLGYNTFGDRTRQVDAEGRTTTSTLDRAGRIVEQIFPAYTPPGGQPITPKASAGYDAAGQLISSTDRSGQTTTAVYDALGRKVRATAPRAGAAPAAVWIYDYDLLGEALGTIDPTGARSESTYDDLGRQITLTTIERKPSQAVYVTRMEYDDANRVVKTIRPTGDASTRAYDATGALTAQTDALGNTTTFAYDLAGRPVKTTNPLGLSTTATYDLANRKTETRELDADGATLRTRTFGYDLAGNLISQTSPEGHTVNQVFDAANRLIEVREPVSATERITSTFGYSATGGQTRSTDGRGNATYTTYNSLGLIESVIEPSTAAHPNPADRTWTTGYDAAGNPVTSLIPGGVRVDRVFDELSRLTKESGIGAEVATEDKTFGYDLAGRVVSANDLSFTLNDRGLLLKTTGTGGDVNAYAYDANSRLTQRVDITGTTAFTWDDADRLTQSADPVSATVIDYGYDKASRLTSMTYGAAGARRGYTYDALNRLTKDRLTTSSGGAIASIEYGYDLDDNLTSKTTSGTAGAGQNTYTYDWSNRLTSWTAPDNKKTDYAWDAAGNRIKAGDKTFAYDERNRLTSGDGHTYTYTARGTLKEDAKGIVHITKFDAFDRLINDDTVTYDYDALDRIQSRTQGGQTAHHVYDGLTDNLVAVTDAANVKKASFGRDALGRTLGISDGGSSAQLAFSDLRGDLVGAFTADGTALVDSVAYDPFGEVITRTGATHTLGYQGGYTDPSSGKVNMAARWYQPSTGSFVSRDTLTQNPDPSVQLNRYAYANDNPLTNIDPDGHKAKKATKVAVKATKTTMKTTKSSSGTSVNSAKCPKGAKKGKGAICNDAAGEYRDCRKEKNSTGICQGMKNDYVSCRGEKRAGNYKGNHGVCSEFANDYVTCRTGSDYYSGQSHGVCSGAGREVRRCQYGEIDNDKAGYGQSTGSCRNVRFDYYSCRADKRGDDPGCSTFSEVSYKCALHKNVQCNDLEGKFLSCYKGGRGGSANECAFGVNMLVHCRDSANRKVFEDKNTCNNTWKTFFKECQGSNGLDGTVCTKGESWQDVSYAICEKRKHGHMCVTYISPQDGLKIDKGGSLPLVFVTAGLDICAAVLGPTKPVVAGGCGVAKAVIDIINGIIDEIEQSAISTALDGSTAHGEGGGIQMITWTYDCPVSTATRQYGPKDCGPQHERVIRKEYAPL
ncbi:RHS repeat-associated core domain-containing protein [Streptosporangium amethystogenes subsp. fukuiense]|uniref:RHS repeat-associated core domain-containing protein n=1 Tax=Streptosporangium amethystogenes subsp. fukuiense TaxID=698418 RepID=A0ABW2T1B2_9ACTN